MTEYIDREALRNSVESIDWYSVFRGKLTAGAKSSENPFYKANDIYSAIDNAPTADVAPVRHGRWIHPKGYVVSNGFLCSECGHEEASHLAINPRHGGVCLADDNGNFFYPPKINYCPNCGAKMDLKD